MHQGAAVSAGADYVVMATFRDVGHMVLAGQYRAELCVPAGTPSRSCDSVLPLLAVTCVSSTAGDEADDQW